MKFYNAKDGKLVSFSAKVHKIKLGNCGECKMFFHMHHAAEILFVLSGELTVQTMGKAPERVPAGSCALLLPFQSHSYIRPKDTEYIRINFLSSVAKSFFTAHEGSIGSSSVFKINLEEYAPFISLIEKNEVSLLKAKGFLYSILADYEKQTEFIDYSQDDSVLSKVTAYLNSHLTDKLSLSEVASALGYNEKYLSRCINQSAGFGFSTLISVLRMEAARYLLKNTDRTILDIGLECGFGSERTFYRKFKEIAGVTPSEYRSADADLPVVCDVVVT